MSSRCRGTALIYVLALALGAGGVEAQTLYGSVTGTILDSSGAAVPGATVSLTNEGTGLEFSAVSDETGTYTIRNIPGGNYTLEGLPAGLQGIRPDRRPGHGRRHRPHQWPPAKLARSASR